MTIKIHRNVVKVSLFLFLKLNQKKCDIYLNVIADNGLAFSLGFGFFTLLFPLSITKSRDYFQINDSTNRPSNLPASYNFLFSSKLIITSNVLSLHCTFIIVYRKSTQNGVFVQNSGYSSSIYVCHSFVRVLLSRRSRRELQFGERLICNEVTQAVENCDEVEVQFYLMIVDPLWILQRIYRIIVHMQFIKNWIGSVSA